MYSSKEKIIFLAALIEGEGTITINKSNKRKNGRHILIPKLSIANSNVLLLEEVSRMLTSLGYRNSTYWKRRNNFRAPSGQLYVTGYLRLCRLLESLEPYLICKLQQSKVVREMCLRRVGKYRCAPYSTLDYTAIATIRELNMKPAARLRLNPPDNLNC